MSDKGIEDAINDSQAIRAFVGIDLSRESAPDATTSLKFRHLLEAKGLTRQIFDTINGHLAEKGLMMREGTIVDAMLFAAPPSTKNKDGKRDPAMHQSKKGNDWHVGMKAILALVSPRVMYRIRSKWRTPAPPIPNPGNAQAAGCPLDLYTGARRKHHHVVGMPRTCNTFRDTRKRKAYSLSTPQEPTMSPLCASLCVLTLALPATAMADTVTLVTRSSGHVYPSDTILSGLGITVDDYDLQPYTMMLSTTFDTSRSRLAQDGSEVWSTDADVIVEFTIGTQTYRQAGLAYADISAYDLFGGGEAYAQSLNFDRFDTAQSGLSITFSQALYGPVGSFGNHDVLAPRTFATSDGQMQITAFNANPEAPAILWGMSAQDGNYALKVLSPVAEPSPAALFAAGTLLLGAWRLRKTRAGARQSALNDRPAAPTPAPTPTC